MNFDNKKIMPRYTFVVTLLALAGIYIVGNAVYLMLARKEYWETVSKLFVRENIPLPANRGNILSADGQIMASNLPEYKIYMDYVAYDRDSCRKAKAQHWRDSAFRQDIDSIAEGLHAIFPDKTAKEFKERLEEGRKRKSRYWRIYPRRISYIQYKECKQLPLFRETPNKGGFYAEEFNLRKKPFGSLASRTLGAVYASKDSARFGLELSFDSILRGTPGMSHRTKVRHEWIPQADVQPIDGNDIETTIDVAMQDAAEKALMRKLKEINAEMGVAILMETATGDVKAIVNLSRDGDGEYREMQNHAVGTRMEPGSTFKTASIMVALEDRKITKEDFIDTGCGIWPMHGRHMKDHNWRNGGYGRISVPEVLMYSSNVGVSRIIDDNYHNEPEKFVDGLYKLGVGVPLNLPLVGYLEPSVRRPAKDGSNWSKTALPWMSIGYETLLAPINTLTFYNGIANNGKVVKPRFVRAERKNGKVIREFPVEVIRERMCSQHTLDDIREILEMVVSKGLGKKAGCKQFHVSGKTGTAQVSKGKGAGYHTGTMSYLVSFCGYFPSEAPKYSCIVAIRKNGLPASGGGQCGPVFSEIAQIVMTKGVFRSVQEAADSTSVFIPDVKNGNWASTDDLLKDMHIETRTDERTRNSDNPPLWAQVTHTDKNVELTPLPAGENTVPDVQGMGARDAVFALEQAGMRVRVQGSGRVKRQSIAPGAPVGKGQTVRIELEH